MRKTWLCLVASTLLWSQGAPKSARVLLFEARPSSVKVGSPVELAWATQDAAKVILEPPGEEVAPLGRRVVTPQTSTVYWLHATNAEGGQSVPVTVAAEAEPKPESKSEPRPVPEPPPPAGPGFWIQFGALANEARARELQGELGTATGEPVRLSQVEAPASPGLRLHRVRMGPFPTRRAAQLRLRQVRAGAQALGLRPVVMTE